MSHRDWREQGAAKPFHPSDLDPQQAKVDRALRESLELVHEKLDRIMANIRKAEGK